MKAILIDTKKALACDCCICQEVRAAMRPRLRSRRKKPQRDGITPAFAAQVNATLGTNIKPTLP